MSELYDDSMLEYCEDYAVLVMERFAEAQTHTKDAKIFLEKKLDMTTYVPDGFGTADVAIIADGFMETIDLKYGKGVAVDVTENKQQMLYALGALVDFNFIYEITDVRMTIYQPRIGNIASWEVSVTDLLSWAENELKPKAQMAFNGEGEFAPGNHCRFCRGKAKCKALATYNLELAAYDFKDSNLLEDGEIADILTRSDMFTSWITAVEEHALNEAVNNGKKWPGYKVVEGRSNRKYEDADKVAETLKGAGYKDDIIFTKKLLSITNLEKEIGKKPFGDLVGPMLIKPPGKPTLVPESDKRPAYHSAEAAKADFQNA